MKLVFGWNNFRIKSYSPLELGIITKEDNSFSIEIRQKYFHLFWIPFFGIGKYWVIRKQNKLYEVPEEYKYSLVPFKKQIKSPWYTFFGFILLALSGLGFLGYDAYTNYQDRQQSIAYFNAGNRQLEEQLSHLTTNDFITLREINNEWGGNRNAYARIESIEGDKITVTPFESTISSEPMDVEKVYDSIRPYTPVVVIPIQLLKEAFPKNYDSSIGTAIVSSGRELLGDGKKYIVNEVVPHYGPIIEDSKGGLYASYEFGVLTLYFSSSGWPATVTGIKVLTGTADWSENMQIKIPEWQTGFRSDFKLIGKNYPANSPYKFILILQDTTGLEHKYEVEGRQTEKTIKKIR